MYRSRSLDLSNVPRGERYLSRWSRENTPIDSGDSYKRQIRRSFTPVREISAYQTVHDHRRAFSVDRYKFNRDPVAYVTTPYHTNYNHYSESQPVRKYDVFQVRTWSYPIYKYIYGRDHQCDRPYSYTRQYATKSLYTPPLMTPECKSATARRGYSGYNYVSGADSFNFSTRPWSTSTYKTLRTSHVASSTNYWYGRSNLRHYNSYRPLGYTSLIQTSYSKPYF